MNVRFVSVALMLLTVGCNRQPPGRQYELQGQILAIEPARKEVVIKHDAIKGFMPAMTMPFRR